MNALAKEGFVVLGGPLEAMRDVLLVDPRESIHRGVRFASIERSNRPDSTTLIRRHAARPSASIARCTTLPDYVHINPACESGDRGSKLQTRQ
jgi:hypothetical protein